MRDSACGRIRDAGGILRVWGVLIEDVYETRFGDGFYLHLRGLALNQADAEELAQLDPSGEMIRWHVRPYDLGLRDSAPWRLDAWRAEEEFSINTFIELLAEIPSGESASLLMVGAGAPQRSGPNMRSLARARKF